MLEPEDRIDDEEIPQAGPSRTITPRNRKRPAAEISTPPIRRSTSKSTDPKSQKKIDIGDLGESKPTATRTPLTRASPGTNRGTPTPRTKKSQDDGHQTAPAIPAASSPLRKSHFGDLLPSRPSRKLFGSNVAEPLPTPSPNKRRRIASPQKPAEPTPPSPKRTPKSVVKAVMPAAVKPAAVKPAAVKPAAVRPAAVKPAAVKPAAPKPTPRKAKAPVKSKRKEAAIEEAVLDVNTDDVNREEEEEEEEEEYHSELPEVSRESFLANEALKRQREARNFKYKGDANAPTLTRSGKVVGKANVEKEPESQEEDEADVYGTMETDPAVDDAGLDIENPFVVAPVRRVSPALAPLQPLSTTLVPKPSEDQAESYSILPGARPYLHKILLTLTSAGTSTDPAPFPDEGTHEALQGLVNLLRGTVERGEGNSALIVGARGVGKTRTMARALSLLPSSSTTSPIVVRLSGLAQTNDRLAIKEMGRQIAEAEGKSFGDIHGDDEDAEHAEDAEYAPTTLPSHLLALLTAPSPRSIIIVVEEFDLFTEHARQALLYCLLDVVQSVKTGPVDTTGRGVAVIGLTSRIDTLLLLEKRVKSRFSHRMWRVASPLSANGTGWKTLLLDALIPWPREEVDLDNAQYDDDDDMDLMGWRSDWQFAVEMLLDSPKIVKALDRLCSLTTNVRELYRPFIPIVSMVLSGRIEFIPVPRTVDAVMTQIEHAGWGLQNAKLKGLPQPCLGILVIAKHLHYAGREEFNFEMVKEEYERFGRVRLVGSGKVRWPIGVLKTGFEHLLKSSLLVKVGGGNVKPPFQKVRCALSPHEIVAWMKGDGAIGMGNELVSWGRLLGGHV